VTPLVRTLVSIALLMHGLGMIGGAVWLALPKGEHRGFGDSWLLIRLGRVPQEIIAVVLWGTAGVSFVAAAYGFWSSASWFSTAIFVGAPATLAAVALWAGAVPVGTYIGAAFALAMLLAVGLGWLPQGG
jgi:hypothetical protein